MRYNPNAYADYPILRPHSSDYPEGRISTRLVQTRDDNNLHIMLEFEIHEPGIVKQIEKGDATCCAFLYCSNTCYSEMLRADQGTTKIAALTPLSRLKGRVELNPSVIATGDLVLRTDVAHPEYREESMTVQVRKQLAMDEPWHFAVGLVGTIESVFQLDQCGPDESLEDGEFDFRVDSTARYIVIRANAKTHRSFQDTRKRGQIQLTKASVYLSALTAALGSLDHEYNESEPAEGWAATVRTLIQEQGIQWPDACGDGLAAQRLMRKPLAALPDLSELVQRGGGL